MGVRKDLEQCSLDIREHFCRIPTPAQAAAIIFYVTAMLAVIICFSLGYLQRLSDYIRDELGVEGHVILGSLIAYTGLPFGWGWSLFVAAAGYTYGWLAVATAYVGTVVGHALGFVTSRYWCRRAVTDKVITLPEKWQELIYLAQSTVNERCTAGIGFVVLVRAPPSPHSCGPCSAYRRPLTRPAAEPTYKTCYMGDAAHRVPGSQVRWGAPFTFGICNAFDAALAQMSYPISLAGSVIACSKDIVLQV